MTGERKVKVCDDGAGYMRVSLCKKGLKRSHRVHQLVASAFIDNPYEYTEVNHIDLNKSNNNVENLEWCTRSENMLHYQKHKN